MKFVVAYSGGKDCTLALDKMIQAGHEPVALLMCMELDNTSVMHRVSAEVMSRYEEALNLPIIQYRTFDHHIKNDIFEAIKKVKELGCEAIVTGDIAFESAKKWNQEVCDNAGLKLICPLWGIDREQCLNEIIERGYKTIITGISEHSIPTSFLGRELDKKLIEELKKYNIDITGENGEYHTMTIDGPIFKKPLSLSYTDIIFTDYKDEYLEIK